MITSIKPKVESDGRYNVTETCNHLGIYRGTLQKYTEQNLIKCGFRKTSARKFYLGREIVRFWEAQML